MPCVHFSFHCFFQVLSSSSCMLHIHNSSSHSLKLSLSTEFTFPKSQRQSVRFPPSPLLTSVPAAPYKSAAAAELISDTGSEIHSNWNKASVRQRGCLRKQAPLQCCWLKPVTSASWWHQQKAATSLADHAEGKLGEREVIYYDYNQRVFLISYNLTVL